MADFRIDRIRFRWRGDWSAGTLYVKDDVQDSVQKFMFVLKYTHQTRTFTTI